MIFTELLTDAAALFFYGVYADIYGYIFERKLMKSFLSGNGISSPNLTAKSNKNYSIRRRLRKMEREFQYKIYAK